MIISFKDRATEDIFNGDNTKAARSIPQSIWSVAFRKLDMINAAHDICDLRVPQGNMLERLKGSLSDHYSIRINDQYRVVFSWSQGNARDVLITDYH
jgi:proteic killer suppression protein